jgi:predicted phosphodiesterase
MSRVLVCGDLHCPYDRPGYLDFCKDLYKQHKCDTVVFIGDIADLHAVSYHEKHPESDGPGLEVTKAKTAVQRWYKAFGKATVTIGNHDRLFIRKAATNQVPEFILKGFNEIWGTPGWSWVKSKTIDGVLYMHGEGCGGLWPAYNTMRKIAASCVLGHFHTAAGLKFMCNSQTRLFGMDVGCGIKGDAIQFLYAENNPCKPIISAGIIIDGEPNLYLMPMKRGEKYHDSQYRK